MKFPNFDGIRYFKPEGTTDQWGSDPSKISPELLKKVDQLRLLLGHPMHVTSGYRPKDYGSQHALGLALDLVCPAVTLRTLYQAAEHIGFNGLGVYPAWRYDGQVVGGVHVDVRELNGNPKARWMGVPGVKIAQEYIALNPANLKKYGVYG